MTARDTIARVLFDEGGADERVRAYEITETMVAVIRAMPVEEVADLVGGSLGRLRYANPDGSEAIWVKR